MLIVDQASMDTTMVPMDVVISKTAFIKQQLDKFLSKEYLFKISDTIEYEFELVNQGVYWFNLSLRFRKLMGYTTEYYDLKTPEGHSKVHYLFGSKNRSSRQSILNLLDRNEMVLYIDTKNEEITRFQLGIWFNNRFFGVQVKL